MKKKLFAFLIALSQFVRSPASISAEEDVNPGQFNPTQTLTNETIDQLNPLQIAGSQYTNQFSTPGGIISQVIFFAFPLAGIILLVMLVWAGFEMVSGATNKNAQEAGKQRATAAVLGFILLFVSYWIIRLVEAVTGAKIF